MEAAPAPAPLVLREAMTSAPTTSSTTLPTLSQASVGYSVSEAHNEPFTLSSEIDAQVYALTTIFTPPAPCLAPTYTLSAQVRGGYADQLISDDMVIRGFRPDCFPPHYLNPHYYPGFPDSPGNNRPASYFSPGICPSGYETAQFTYGTAADTVTCCPVGMTADETASSDCTATATSITMVNGTNIWQQNAQILIAPSIVVAFATSDQFVFQTLSTSGPSATQAAPTTSNSVVSSPGSPGLSTAGKAGLSFGVAVGVLLIAGLIIAILMKHKRQQAHRANHDLDTGLRKTNLTQHQETHELNERGSGFGRSHSLKSRDAVSVNTAERADEDWAGWELAAGVHRGAA